MSEIRGYAATDIIRAAFQQAYVGYWNSDGYDERARHYRDFVYAATSGKEIAIEMEAPHLISWNVVREHEGQTYVKREKAKIGRWLSRSISPLGFSLTDAQIESFVNIVKAEVSMDGIEVELITGEEIRDAYHWVNEGSDAGDMGGSCMREDFCQPFMNIYTENTEVVSLAVIKDGNEYVARALIWKDINGKRWMDRIYSNMKHAIVLNAWAKENDIESVYDGNYGSNEGVVVKLQKGVFDYYPYMDSMYSMYRDGGNYYLVSGGGHLPTGIPNLRHYAELRSTNGGPFNAISLCEWCENAYTEPNQSVCEFCAEYMVECSSCEEEFHEDTATYLDNDQPVCDYCYRNHCSDCEICDTRHIDNDLVESDNYGLICSNCDDDLETCGSCNERNTADDLNSEGNCEGCEAVEEETSAEKHPETRLVECSDGSWRFVTHEWSPEINEWVPMATQWELGHLRDAGVTFEIPSHVAERQASFIMRRDMDRMRQTSFL